MYQCAVVPSVGPSARAQEAQSASASSVVTWEHEARKLTPKFNNGESGTSTIKSWLTESTDSMLLHGAI